MYIKSLFKFSLEIEDKSTISQRLMQIQRSSESTLLRLSRQKGHDCDRARLESNQETANMMTNLTNIVSKRREIKSPALTV